jgi:hypothetical protein
VSAPATADQAGNWIKAAGSELKARLAWIISYASQLLATFAAIVITFWIIAVAIEDQVNPVGCGGSAVQWLRQAVLWFCLAAIAVAIVAAFIEYSIIHGLFRGSVKHVPVHAIFTSPQDNLQWFLEERLMPGIRRLLRPAGYALNLAVIGLIAATSMTLLQAPDMPARRRTGNDLPYEQYLTRCFQRLTLAIYIGAVLLALSVVQVGARHSWPLSLISGDPNKLLQDAVGQLGLLYGTIFSLFLVALYGPAVVILRRRAWQLVRATEPTGTTTTHTQWLTERNLSFTL